MPFTDLLTAAISKFGQILVAPIKNPELLWIVIPIYINWIATDYFQERKGTDFGNAITNGIVTLWVGVDWLRQLSQNFVLDLAFLSKIALCVLLLIYSLLIIFESAKAKKIAHYIGRVREVSYFMLVLTPIVYGVIDVDKITIFAIILFFPIWYLIGEAIDRALPAPPGEEKEVTNMPELKGLEPELPPETAPETALPEVAPQQPFPNIPSSWPSLPSQPPRPNL